MSKIGTIHYTKEPQFLAIQTDHNAILFQTINKQYPRPLKYNLGVDKFSMSMMADAVQDMHISQQYDFDVLPATGIKDLDIGDFFIEKRQNGSFFKSMLGLKYSDTGNRGYLLVATDGTEHKLSFGSQVVKILTMQQLLKALLENNYV